MRFTGVAWTGTGFEVALLDAAGRPAAETRFAAGRVGAVTAHLLELQRAAAAAGEELVTVIDSTNGMLDGGLMAAGLAVYRADPWMLPPRPAFGSVPAAELARTAFRDPAAVVRLSIDTGTLGGRAEEMIASFKSGAAELEAMLHSGRCLWNNLGADKPVVALTFDDGPNPPYTNRILDVLDRYAVPATFFCVGLHALAHRAELDRMATAGHQLANHTWSHPYLPDLSRTELLDQLGRTDEAISLAVGDDPGPRMFRPPYGSQSPDVLRWIGESGATIALWNVEPSDWSMPGPDAITRTVLEHARPGAMILLHDGGGDRSQTVAALPGIIEGLVERGYGFARVDELPVVPVDGLPAY
ncbi:MULTISPECIES: polysaccharide deacetylase family protein [Kitasatospora]|uniref:Putative hydrolase n=1 Tax=Kitasatospora setae (strain ATCC 33774 / DSM 43861 / JCM 3304 / KCC A-0304 / NBRC 14216 / KM-6054) TaxID=452652 RepID=E4N753_KITSK|nr:MULTISPECIES: polysaccharide deacetylase family protein [Kitasatospora]BAJ27034.1 putative hydrolase [Kitasatospora setae KM-6054]